MEKKTPKNHKMDIEISPTPDADLIVNGEKVDLKMYPAPPHVEDEKARQGVIIARIGRHGSKAQWYCSVDESNERAKKFAAAVRLARAERGWNQAECAKKLSISQPQFSTLESGDIEPLPSKVFEIEKMFEMPAGNLSKYFGYHPNSGDDREVILQTAEKLDYLVVMGEYALEQVLIENRGASLVEEFVKDAEDIGLDAIAAIAKVSNKLLKALNTAVSEAMPKVFQMKQAEMTNLSSRIISLIDNETINDYDYDRLIREAREKNPNLEIQ